jgi:hypothetical protein
MKKKTLEELYNIAKEVEKEITEIEKTHTKPLDLTLPDESLRSIEKIYEEKILTPFNKFKPKNEIEKMIRNFALRSFKRRDHQISYLVTRLGEVLSQKN